MNYQKNPSLLRKLRFPLLISLFVIAIFSWRCHSHSAPQTVTRAAVDVGSGGLKVTVAKVDPLSQKICKVLYATEQSVPLKRDMQARGKSEFSDAIQQVALTTLANLQKNVASYEPTEWRGIATAASRQASNAQEMYDKIEQELGVSISIISQAEEGRLGFLTAASVSGIDPEHLIAFDSGSGSFQLSTLIDGELQVVEGELGYIPSLEALMKIRGQTLDAGTLPEPVTLEEADQLVQMLQEKIPVMSGAFIAKLKDPRTKVVGIGNENFIFAMGATGVGKTTYTKEELRTAIEKHAGRPAEQMKQFSKPQEAVLGMVLLFSIMDAMGIDELTYCYANGSCEGLLVDSDYWPASNIG